MTVHRIARGRRRALPPLLAAALAASLVSTSGARAAERPAQQATDRPETARAAEQAARTGEEVEVISERTEFTTTYANPSGTFTQETHVVPIRVRQSGRLVDADPTLVRAKDGSIHPKATSVGLEFSRGGNGAELATIKRDGRSMSLGWPGELPTPSLDGDTAIYREVLPGIDLKLRASVTGFQQLLVVKNRQAAANPRLKRLALPMKTRGVTARTDRAGNLKAVNPAGQELFTAPTPVMWDSSGIPAGQTARKGLRSASEALSAQAAPKALAAPTTPTTPGIEDDGFVPAVGAKEKAVGATLQSGSLNLTPDQSLLMSPDTVFPVHIDPYVSGARNNWTAVAKKYPTTSYYNKSDNVARVGYESDTGGTWRSLFTMDTRNLHGKTITKSTFRIKNTHSWSCTKKPVELWAVNPISSSTTWNNQPTWASRLATVTDAKGWSGSCPAGNLEFPVRDNAIKAAERKWNTMTLGLRANESDTFGWKKFDAKTAVLSTEYNTPPAAPTGYGTNPVTECNASPYSAVGNTDVDLYAKVSDPDGDAVKARFIMWPTGGSGNVFDKTVSVSSGSVARVTVPKSTFKDRVSYSWQVQASDGKVSTAWTPNPPCRFTVYLDRPSTPPTISSTEFPSGDAGWPTDTSPVRTKGTFLIGPGEAKDISSYEYWSSLDQTVRTLTPATVGSSASVTLTPAKAGPHRLYVRGLDRAGNRSDARTYLFYANGSTTADKDGDLNGDGHPDLWAVDGDGTLQRYFGDGSGKAVQANQPASPASLYQDARTTRRGDWTDDGYEDLIALIPDSVEQRKRLWVHPNDGSGAVDPSDRRELQLWDPSYDHFQNADQVLAVGDVDGPLDLDGDGTIGPDDRPGYPDLLVREGEQLWLYFGSASGYLDEYLDQPPVLLNEGDWSGYELMAPADANGDGRVDLLARQKSTGALYLYPGTGAAGEGLGNPAGRSQIGTGWTTANRPLVTSIPDVLSDGKPSVWATDANGALLFYPDIKGSGAAAASTLKGFRSLN
ncbi:FG-GAP-like repeat-containing protein [Streptomyces sp. NPDC006879]|uniref:FG-GAP-like repeat-containing protein n=1 Tax=Streptomyces sp. NPDC006879 TaxID=3364767 RepID=UPI0036A06137